MSPAVQMDQPLAEIVVTAQKREQRLQDVGLTVTAIGAQTLALQRIDTVGDLARVVPGLEVTPSPTATPVYTLRGVGFFDTAVAAYPDVASYIDQAPLPLPAFTALTAFDLDRIEVLKGPQGTLFGNNATGGAINFVAAKPTSAFDSGAEIGYSRFNTAEGSGFVSGPLADQLDGRLAVKVTNGGDWQESYTRPDHLGKTNELAARMLLDWKPSDRLDLLLNVNGWRDRDDPEAPQLARPVTPADLQAPIGTTGATGTVGPNLPLLHYPSAPSDPRAADWNSDYRPFQNNQLWQTTLTGTYQLSDDLALTFISDFINYHMDNATDQDGTALADDQTSSDRADSTSFSQEIRLANTDPTDRTKWVIGANYEKTRVSQIAALDFQDGSSGTEQGFTADEYDSFQHMRNVAGFGNIEFKLTDQLALKGGARYTSADRTTLNQTLQLPGYVEPYPGAPGLVNLINYIWGNIYTPIFCPGVTYVPITPADSVSINPKTCVAGNFRDELDEHNASWSTGLDYKVSADLLLYVNIAKGYKAGSFPTVSGATQAQYAPVTQESVLDYEGGFKVQLADNRVSIDAAAFYYDYTDKQLLGLVVDPLFGQLQQLINVPKSNALGAETEILMRPISELTIRMAATYLHTKIDTYDGVVGVTRTNGLAFPVTASFTGVPLPFAPKYQGSVSADYTVGAIRGWSSFVGTTISGQTSSEGSPELNPQAVEDAKISGYALLDLRAGIQSPDSKWKVMVWGKNVTNKYYWTNSLRNADTIVRYAGRPGEFGISLSWRH